MVIYLKHPEHGKKVAISPFEVANDKKHGWVEYPVDENGIEVSVEAENDTNAENEEELLKKARIAFEEKFGVKPHHAKKLKNILKEIAEG